MKVMILPRIRLICLPLTDPNRREKSDIVFTLQGCDIFSGLKVRPEIYETRLEKNPQDFHPRENKGADQLSSNCTAEMWLCFCYTNSMITLLLTSKILILDPFSETKHAGTCMYRTGSDTWNTGFLALRLILEEPCFVFCSFDA